MKYFLPFLIILLTIRFALVILPSFEIDMNAWQAWTARLVEVGPTNFYSPGYFADYFPGYLYFLWILGLIFKIFTQQIFSNEFAITLKFLTNIFDVGSAFLIYKIVFKYNNGWAKPAGLLYLANPALIFNSSVWGQVDGILTFFLVLSVYFLVEIKKLLSWSITTALAILIKPQALAILPLIFLYILRNFAIKKAFFCIAGLFVLSIIISIPFFPQDPLFGLINLFRSTAEGYKYTSLYAFNFWAIVGWWRSDIDLWFLTTYQLWGVFFYFIALFYLIFSFMKSKPSNKPFVYLIMALSILIFFLFPTRVHERYLFPFFAFFLTFAMIKRSVFSLIIYVGLSAIHLANLWYVYYFYNYIYNNAEISIPIVYTLIDSTYKGFSILTLFAFLILLFVYSHGKNSL